MIPIHIIFLIVSLLLAGTSVHAAQPYSGPAAQHESPGIETEIEFDSDQLSWLVAPEGVRNRKKDHDPEGAMTGRVLHSIQDFNGDGVEDIGIFELTGGSLKKMHSSYQVHFGEPGEQGTTVFATEVGAEVNSDGIPFEIQLSDFDDDGRVDISIMVIDPGFLKMIGMVASAVFRDSISLELELYTMNDDRYPASPDVVRRIHTVSLGKSGETAAIFPTVIFDDFDGDCRTDLLVQDGPDQHLLYPGVEEPHLFARKPQPYAMATANQDADE
jgi:hypothetical protein